MALDMTPEQREIGKANFHRTVGGLAHEPAAAGGGAPASPGMTRRGFMKGMLAAGAVLPVSAAAYFGYTRLHGNPVRAGLIGAGDEGGVLVGEHNPEFLEFVAYSDIRPYNQERIFRGEPDKPSSPRKGFNRIYGNNAKRNIRLYEDYRELLARPDIEMVVIALPLHLHAQATMDALRAGKHVLCEKLMARNIRQCKDMIRVADETDKLLAIGHQRHYSLLYAQAYELLQNELLGEVHHIRALWHRNNLPGKDSWRPAIRDEDRRHLESRIRQLGYRSMDELVRWRLFQRTGAGLMAELGSHQLDACSIFLGKKHPLAVSGVGGKFYYNDEREVEDHVFCSFEFPGKRYDASKPQRYDAHGIPVRNDVVVVTYSSISTNSFERYGECVMGTKGTLVVENEQEALLYPAQGRGTTVGVTRSAAGQPALDTSASTGGPAEAAQTVGQRSLGAGTVSRGYREEMEHLAWIIRMREQGMARDRADMTPRCPGRAAMADAIIALTANQAMRAQCRVEFDPRWFEVTPDAGRDVYPSWDPPIEGV